MIFQREKRKIFLRFFISYIIILLIPVIIGSYAYYQAIRVVEEDAVEMSLALLEQERMILDRYLSDVHNIIKQMAVNLSVNQISYTSGPVLGEDIFKVFMTQKELSTYNLTSDFIGFYYIYFKNGNVIITPDTSYLEPRRFYSDYLATGGMNYEQWFSIISESDNAHFMPGTVCKINETDTRVLTYFQSIPLQIFGVPKGCIAILIPENEILKLLEPIYTKNGYVLITDATGNRIAASSYDNHVASLLKTVKISGTGTRNITIGKQKMLMSYTVSTKYGWKYIATVPVKVVMAKLDYIKRTTVMIVLAILLAGVLAAFVIAYRNSRPLQRMVKAVIGNLGFDAQSSKNDFDLLENAITTLIHNNEYLQKAMEDQMPFIRAAFFDHLIKGELTGFNEIQSILTLINTEMKGDRFCVLLIQLNRVVEFLSAEILAEIEKNKIMAKDIIRKCLGTNCFIHDVDNHQMMILLCYEKMKTTAVSEEIRAKILKLIRGFNDVKINTYFGVGDIYESLLDVYKSFNEAKQALEYVLIADDKNIMEYIQLPRMNNSYYYPLEVQIRLFNLVKAGQKTEMDHLLNDVYQENMVKRQLSTFMLKQFLYEIRGTVLKLWTHINQQLSPPMELPESLSSYDHIVKTLNMFCTVVQDLKKQHKRHLINNISGYISSNYMNAQISLSSVASKFGMNETYLSYFFKEQTGENFSLYLEQTRIKCACELLSNKNIAVNEIAEKVGYNSDQSFRRAFKRIMGIRPSDYKKNKIV